MVHKIRINPGWSRCSATPGVILIGGVIVIVSLFTILCRVQAIDISASGGWTETIDEADLVSGAGSDLIDTYQSITNATTANISNCADDSDNWEIDVRRVDGTWDGDFTLYVKRTSDGEGSGSISGGISYIEITTTDTQFFTGAGNRNNVDLQYELTGMSISASPENYSTIVVFTVVDIP
jgi:hypothetical protein